MSAEAYPRTSMKSGYYKRIVSTESNRKENYDQPVSYLYIGNDAGRVERISATFQYGFVAEHYNSALNTLENLQLRNEALPDVIIIDVPFSEVKLSEFIQFLRQSPGLGLIPVIYNRKFVVNGYKDCLKRTRLVDDMIDLDAFPFNLLEKVAFLKEARFYSTLSPLSVVQKRPPAEKIGFGKRLLDTLLAGSALLVLMPFFLLIAIIIKLESRGPVFYTSSRAGRGFRIFRFYKFRTMEVDADKKLNHLAHLNQYNNTNFFKVRNDPRVTRFGAILRKTSLDELPQLFNVLLGDMSIVGNRPLPLYEAATLTTNESIERFMAPAGMTGLWQIKKRGRDDMSTEERISLDIAYARKHSLAYDLWIMANTPGALFQKSNV